MTSKSINMTLSKSTKGTHVYASNDDNAPISTVYIKRASLSKTPPSNIKLTVEYDER